MRVGSLGKRRALGLGYFRFGFLALLLSVSCRLLGWRLRHHRGDFLTAELDVRTIWPNAQCHLEAGGGIQTEFFRSIERLALRDIWRAQGPGVTTLRIATAAHEGPEFAEFQADAPFGAGGTLARIAAV